MELKMLWPLIIGTESPPIFKKCNSTENLLMDNNKKIY